MAGLNNALQSDRTVEWKDVSWDFIKSGGRNVCGKQGNVPCSQRPPECCE